MKAHELTLYYKPTCPFCKKVIKYIDEAGIIVPLEDTSDEEKATELINLGGKKQVPCLVIDGKALYESDDIIEWLKLNGSKTDFEV